MISEKMYVAAFVQYMTSSGQYSHGVLTEVKNGQFLGETLYEIDRVVSFEFKCFDKFKEAEEYLTTYCGNEWDCLAERPQKLNIELLKYMCHDFYQVEHDSHGKAWIHDEGYCYGDGPESGINPETGKEDPEWFCRSVEFSWLYLDPEKLRKDGDDYYNEKQSQVTQYESDCNLEKVISILETDLRNAKKLLMAEVTDATPDGWYVDYKEESK